jgi:glycosyltransferase involved in cell wall biosynthesis
MRSDSRQGRLRVVVVSHAYNSPGRILPFAELAEYVDLTLVTPRVANFAQPQFCENAKQAIDIVVLPGRLVHRSQFLYRGLGKTLRSVRPDVVCVEYDVWHLQFLQVLFNLAMARSAARVVAVVKKNTYRAPDSMFGRGKRLLARWGIRKSSAIIAASAMTRGVYVDQLGVDDSMVVVQSHLPIEVARFRPRETDGNARSLRIGFVGKIGAVKGVPDLLSAFDRLLERTGAPVELLLAGEILDSDMPEQISSAKHVRCVGVVDNEKLHQFMNDLDIFVMPSRILPDHQEHDGRAVLEAMASGLPCVVSNSGILPELVSVNEGRVFPAGDVESMTEALEELVNHPEVRIALGAGARQRALSTVSPAVLSAQRFEIFNKIMEEHGGRSRRR